MANPHEQTHCSCRALRPSTSSHADGGPPGCRQSGFRHLRRCAPLRVLHIGQSHAASAAPDGIIAKAKVTCLSMAAGRKAQMRLAGGGQRHAVTPKAALSIINANVDAILLTVYTCNIHRRSRAECALPSHIRTTAIARVACSRTRAQHKKGVGEGGYGQGNGRHGQEPRKASALLRASTAPRRRASKRARFP